jgi:hypothetical protein
MEDEDFEGTLILERLAELGETDNFYEAVDNDDFGKASAIMKRAGIADEAIQVVLKMMADGE